MARNQGMSKLYCFTSVMPAWGRTSTGLVDFAVSGSKALLIVAEHDRPAMFARIGIMRALNRHVERVFDPTRKEPHWGRRKLARDR
jgi:hypothetical protein